MALPYGGRFIDKCIFRKKDTAPSIQSGYEKNALEWKEGKLDMAAGKLKGC